jgi:hypothetical protein
MAGLFGEINRVMAFFSATIIILDYIAQHHMRMVVWYLNKKSFVYQIASLCPDPLLPADNP